MASPTTLFVYGTLMRGLGNHRLLEQQRFLGRARTLHPHLLLQAGVPFVHPTLPSTLPVQGEVYEVTPEALARIDSLEGHPDWYARTPIEVQLLADGGAPLRTLTASIYFNSLVSHEPGPGIVISDAHIVPSGNFRDLFPAAPAPAPAAAGGADVPAPAGSAGVPAPEGSAGAAPGQ
jgi:gamma-glutamylcyclotransferase (GGCT)/AIG2-like uncharacterized protein YtfP